MMRNYIRCRRRRFLCSLNSLCLGIFIIILIAAVLNFFKPSHPVEHVTTVRTVKLSTIDPNRLLIKRMWNYLKKTSPYTYEMFRQWNKSLCGQTAHQRGPHQKIIAISVFGLTSRYTDNKLFAWNSTIIPYLKALTEEVNNLLPSWIIRIYTDLVGSTQAQRELMGSFSNVDVCDVNDLPMFGSSLIKYLPGKMWRFLPIFDPYVDYTLSRDLDSPMTLRETETLELWLSDEYADKFFYIARDHQQHSEQILGGLWGAAPARARHYLYELFQPMFTRQMAHKFNGANDQLFLSIFVYEKVKNSSLTFDSYFCQTMGGRPFPSKRPNVHCFLGCYRPCCNKEPPSHPDVHVKVCPMQCRPKEHRNWAFC